MKKTFLILFLTIIAITSCERDDICIDETTPDLIIRFYDNDNPTEFKSVNQLSVKIVGIDNDSLTFSTDSITIPIKITEDITQYILTINSNDGTTLNRDTITLNYSREEVFVGRSCGFKTIFNNSTFTNNTITNKWIQSIEVITDPLNIENETTAHVKIFH